MRPSNYYYESDLLSSLNQLSAREPGVRPLESGPIDAATLWPQRLVVQGPRLPFWRFCALPDPRKDPRHKLFTLASGASCVLSSSADARRWLTEAGVLSQRLVNEWEATPTNPLAASELGAWKKLTLQVGHPVFSHIPATNSEPRPLRFPPDFVACMRHVARVYREAYVRYVTKFGLPPDRPDPSTTSGGFPLFVTHPAAKVAGACLGYHHGSYSATLYEAAQWCSQTGLPEDFALANGMGFRSGPVYKWLPIWSPDGAGGWVATHEWRGYSQRRRIIQMSPYPVNRLLRPFFSMLHAARTLIPGMWRTGSEDADLVRGRSHHYESDISGYDAAVQLQLQALVQVVLAEEWPELGPAALTWLLAEQRGLIGPSWRHKAGECTYVSSIGATSSGLKPTAEIGSFIATAVTRYALHLQGDDFANWPENPQCISLHQGDDVRIACDRPLDPAAWGAAYAAVGLDCELIPGYTFLSRLHLPDGTLAPLSGRLVQQTMSNEHEPKGPHALGLVYLGFLARTELAHNCQPDALANVWSLIRHADWIQSLSKWYGVNSVLTLRRHLATHPNAKAVMRASIAAAASDSWLVSHAREAARSPTSALITRLAAERGWDATRFVSADYTCERVCDAVSALPLIQRRSILAGLTEAAYGGKGRLDYAWVDLLRKYT